jgi:hypothetical protein
MARSFAVALCGVALVASMLPAMAREPVRRGRSRGGSASVPVASAAQTAELFAAEAKGDVAVKYIPNDSRSAQVIITNKTSKPLSLQLPVAFAGVPVLAQMGMGMGGGGAGAGFGAGGIGGGPQATGGGLGGQGMNGMGGGGMGGAGGGAFSIPPQKTRVLRVTTVCLEHGKPEPSSRHPFKLAPVESFSSDPKLAIVLESLGRGELSQKVAQAAAWHLSNGLSWEQLAAEKIDHAGGVPDEPYFTPSELMAARQVVAIATQQGAARQPAGEGSSSAIINRQ